MPNCPYCDRPERGLSQLGTKEFYDTECVGHGTDCPGPALHGLPCPTCGKHPHRVSRLKRGVDVGATLRCPNGHDWTP
jgi:predicted RNA-binding Zn-ribbon protein involved in translation (DUF1610 family)